MASLTRTEARDEMSQMLKDAVDAHDPTLKILWQDDDSETRPTDRTPYLELRITHLAGDQTAFGDQSKRVYTRYGMLEVLVYTPEGDGLTLADELATVAQDAYEGVTSPGGICFRGVRAVEDGKSGSFRVTNVIADFEYDELK